MVEPVFIGMIYESIIIIISIILLILIFKRYLEKKSGITLILFIIFLNLTLGIIFSWLSKVLSIYSGIDYIVYDSVKDPGTTTSWILLRISSFRISFVKPLTITLKLQKVRQRKFLRILMENVKKTSIR